ncbi:cob(I)yrinic acid a,c-diamide adenosyltransferase [Alkaliphilus peptidifermentans]|uniref:Cob(I)alamin adenosyltransferase n=1 Tax=Alkaliphilus peptidifermentans DSM 18978 TaxID=1120976 RepID=A0A1G5K2D5_9FIRM|nr:cob(I)yrinic acid a,c-diamide adenosyltransferase [Alkaliphilus peptidifermentans]SCY94726.1 cob(I)alamin adenosyltransferase [Alkaliphilus peptidifermentans DSM 18978]
MKKQLEKGLIHIYTGDGKGKTTAAVGQGTRTAGGGYKVLMVQFLKGDDTGEIHSIEKLAPNFSLIRYAPLNNFYKFLSEEEKNATIREVERGIKEIGTYLESEEYNLIILDEIMAVLFNEIVTIKEVVELIEKKPPLVELILTGRNAPEELINLADYVTEMKMIKHPFEKGIYARKGIES